MKTLYSKKSALLAFGAGLAVLAGCNLNSSDEGKTEVSTYEDLPNCSSRESASGISPVGEKVLVEEEGMSYQCTDDGWVVVSVANFEDLPKCPAKRGKTLGMKVYVEADSMYYLCVNTGWIESDESSDGSMPTPQVENDLVLGSAKVIGPFEMGTQVKLREITSSKEAAFATTDSATVGSVSNRKGDFMVPRVTAYSDFALISVKGLYMDVVSGEVSEDSLELEAVVDLSSGETPAVDVVSHVLAGRVRALVNGGASVYAAMKQAKRELFTAFGFNSDSDEEEVKLAVALLLRANLDEGEFAEAVANFAEGFAETGSWGDEEFHTALADFAFNIENLKIKDEETGEILLKESDYRKNLEKFGNEAAPAFEGHFTKFWVDAYGLGGCAGARQDAVVQNRNELSDSASAFFTCDNQAWRVSTDFERDTVNLGNANDGVLSAGNVDSEKMYVYDTTGFGTGTTIRWKEPDSIVLVIGKACTDYEDVVNTVEKTEDEDENDTYYGCQNRAWTPTSLTTYEIGYMCNASAKNVVEKYKHEKNDSYARCQENKMIVGSGEMVSYVWIPTDEANYDLRDEKCVVYDVFKSGSKYYYCEDSVKVNFKEATEDDQELGVCRKAIVDSIGTYKSEGTSVYRSCGENAYVAGKYEWSVTDKVTYDIGKVCNAKTIGTTGNAGGDSYTCGCSMYDSGAMGMVVKTTLDDCGAYPLAWQKN